MAHLSKQLRAMKRLLTIAACLMCLMSAHAQELNIDNDNKAVTWSKVYDTSMTQDEILEYILAYDCLDNVVTHGNMIAGDIPPVMLDYRSAGYSNMKVATYIFNYNFSGRVIIRTKEGKYKAEVVNMNFGGMSLYECVEGYAFDVTAKLVMQHLEGITAFHQIENEW